MTHRYIRHGFISTVDIKIRRSVCLYTRIRRICIVNLSGMLSDQSLAGLVTADFDHHRSFGRVGDTHSLEVIVYWLCIVCFIGQDVVDSHSTEVVFLR